MSEQDSQPQAPSSVEEDALDLSDLDGLLSKGGEDVQELLEPPRRRGRSPLISLAVIAFGVYLLSSLWADFSYWLSGSEPEDLGDAATWVHNGRPPPGFDNEYVVISGTPDVQHAARLTTKRRFVGYRRITEAGGGLIVAIPRDKDEPVANTFAGRFEGRMRTLSAHGTAEWLKDFFDREGILRIVDASPEALTAALGTGTIETQEGPLELGPKDRIRLVVSEPDATVQLGKSSFPRQEAADQAVEALGLPFIRLDRDSPVFHTYLVRIPEADRDAVQARLNAGLEVPADSADPKVGALVLPRTATYLASLDELGADGGTLRFPYGENTTSPGYDVEDGKLVERAVAEGMVGVPVEQLSAVRVERPIEIDMDGYVVVVGEKPADALTNGVLWLVVLGITLVNVGSVVIWARRRRSA